MRLHRAEMRRQAHAKADLIQAIAAGYGSCRSKDGAKAAQRLLEALRE